MKTVILTLLSLFFVISLSAQDLEIKGNVTMFNTYPVGKITVSAKKAKTSVITDADGSFTLLCKEKDVIQIQEKGFLGVSKKINDRSGPQHINIVFKDTPKNRDMVVARGYIAGEDLLYGLNNLKAENNDYCSYENIFALIKSKFPEVEVKDSPSGGQGVYLRRGNKSFTQDTQMLYILDGMRTIDISFINPCEIAEIKVLTEGAAAIYGAGSSNGALQILSKRADKN